MGSARGHDLLEDNPGKRLCLLGNLAIRVGKRIEWDGPNLKVTNVPEANNHIRREYRKGWTL